MPGTLEIGKLLNSNLYCSVPDLTPVVSMASYLRTRYPQECELASKTDRPSTFYRLAKTLPKFEQEKSTVAFQIEGNKVLTSYRVSPGHLFMDDVFYALRLPVVMQKMNPKFQFLIRQCERQYPGKAVLLQHFLSEADICVEGVPAEFISAMLAYPVTFLDESHRCVQVSAGVYAIYVENIDTIAFIPEALKNVLSYENLLEIQFDAPYLRLRDRPLHEYMPGMRGLYLDGDSCNLCNLL